MFKTDSIKLVKISFIFFLIAFFPLAILVNYLSSFHILVVVVSTVTSLLWTAGLVLYLNFPKDSFESKAILDEETIAAKNAGRELFLLTEAIKNLAVKKLEITEELINIEIEEIRKANA